MALQEAREFISSTGAIALEVNASSSADVGFFGSDAPTSFANKIKKETEGLVSHTITLNEKFDVNGIFVNISPNEQRHSTSHSLITQEWEGCIKEVKDDIFIAHLYKKDINGADAIEGEFDIYDVPEDERHLIKVGMIFYWVLGKETKQSGQISNGDYLIFRRMPSWKNFDVDTTSPTTDEFFSFLTGPATDYTS